METKLHKLYRCEKHPKYLGRKKPKNKCITCLKIYLALHNKPRVPIKPTKVLKDKTKYNRKKKYKGKEDL